MTTVQRDLLALLGQHPDAYLVCSRFRTVMRFSKPDMGKAPAWVTVKALVQAGRLRMERLDTNRVAFRLKVEDTTHV
jgi:hypothetical protein